MVLSLACGGATHPGAAPSPDTPGAPGARPPRLVVWITVDQLSTTSLERFAPHLERGGLGRLLKEGVWFREARYGHAITETSPGHATLFTGAPPRVHGIIANEWFDRATGRVVLSVSDEAAPLVSPLADVPSPRADGRSARQLLAPTVGDALVRATGGRGRVFSISVKDRGAILPAGREGKAAWLGSHGFLTSRAYYAEPPAWLTRHEKEHPISSYVEAPWTLALDAEEYRAPIEPPSPYRPVVLGDAFPHAALSGAALEGAVRFSPAGDRAALELARRVLLDEGLGQDEIPDLLAVSLSSTDYIGHYYGPDSLEAEDNFVRLGQELDELLHFLDKRFEGKDLLVVLSADHGGELSAESLVAQGLPGRRLTRGALEDHTRAALTDKYGSDAFFRIVVTPYVFLDHGEIERSQVPLPEVLGVVEAALRRIPGVHSVYRTAALTPRTPLERAVWDSIHPERSGDLYVVPEPHTLLLQGDDLGATHGSPWDYDSRVPLVLRGAGLEARQVDREIFIDSLAPTVARLLAIEPPATARGAPLDEALSP